MTIRNSRQASCRSLGRHYRAQLDKALAAPRDYLAGVWRFLLWSPKALKVMWKIRIRFRQNMCSTNKIDDVEIADSVNSPTFINLDSRPDRRSATEAELMRMGFLNSARKKAISHENGAIGCARSHIEVLESYHSAGSNYAFICEDDIDFHASTLLLHRVINEFLATPVLDVLCLGFRLRAPRLGVTAHLAIANNIQTTACYVVKRSAIPVILESFGESEKLLRAGVSPTVASIDQLWKKEQNSRLVFAIPRFRVASQRKSFSDIAKSVKRYEP